MSSNEKLIYSLFEIGAIQFGEFTLKSGVSSPIYIDLRRIVSYPEIMGAIADLLWESIRLCQFDFICGVPYTALPITTCISYQHKIPMLMRRKEKKEYGLKQQIEGVFQKGQSCLLIEDIITSGSSVIETAKDLEAAGLVVYDTAIVLDRESQGKQNLMKHNYIVHTVLTLSQVLQVLADSTLLNKQELAIVNQLLLERIS